MRVPSLGNGVAGVLNAAMLSIHAIGQAYARLAGITPKAGVKQVDRM
ncbi:MAG: IS4 family transposase, partial [Polyangiaceae bacterium]|nr:IS4 family transposase [Polyangiaceae bacterium]